MARGVGKSIKRPRCGTIAFLRLHKRFPMLYRNPRAVRAPYPDELRALMNMQRAQEGRGWLSHWGRLNAGATPLRALPALAAGMRSVNTARISWDGFTCDADELV